MTYTINSPASTTNRPYMQLSTAQNAAVTDTEESIITEGPC